MFFFQLYLSLSLLFASHVLVDNSGRTTHSCHHRVMLPIWCSDLCRLLWVWLWTKRRSAPRSWRLQWRRLGYSIEICNKFMVLVNCIGQHKLTGHLQSHQGRRLVWTRCRIWIGYWWLTCCIGPRSWSWKSQKTKGQWPKRETINKKDLLVSQVSRHAFWAVFFLNKKLFLSCTKSKVRTCCRSCSTLLRPVAFLISSSAGWR